MEDPAVAPCLSINTVETSGWWQGSSMSPEQSTPSLLWIGIHWHSCGNIVLRTVTQDFYIFESCDSFVSYLFSYVEDAWSKNFILQTRRVMTHSIFQTRSARLFRFERLHSSIHSSHTCLLHLRVYIWPFHQFNIPWNRNQEAGGPSPGLDL